MKNTIKKAFALLLAATIAAAGLYTEKTVYAEGVEGEKALLAVGSADNVLELR